MAMDHNSHDILKPNMTLSRKYIKYFKGYCISYSIVSIYMQHFVLFHAVGAIL